MPLVPQRANWGRGLFGPCMYPYGFKSFRQFPLNLNSHVAFLYALRWYC